MKLVALVLLSSTTLAVANGDVCLAGKELCASNCGGNFEWACQKSHDGKTIMSKSCQCTKGESVVCGQPREDCRAKCGGSFVFQCKSHGNLVTSRICVCGSSSQAEQCKAREHTCEFTKVCPEGQMVHFACDVESSTAKLVERCTCAAWATKASVFGVLVCLFFVLSKQLL